MTRNAKLEFKVDTRPIRGRVVSVVLVSGGDVSAAIESAGRLANLDWPADLLEIVVVGPRAAVAAEAKARGLQVRVADAPADASLADARNRGAEKANGEWLAFLDRDAQADPGWIRAALRAMRANANTAVIASKVLDHNGNLAYVDAALTAAGEPILPHAGASDTGAHDGTALVLFPSPWAFVLETKAFRWVGGFDSVHCRDLAHVDLGWRLSLAGLRVRYHSESLVHLGAAEGHIEPSSTMGGIEMLYKNLEEDRVTVALELASASSTTPFEPTAPLVEARTRAQAIRRVPDMEILPLFHLAGVGGSADVDPLERGPSEEGTEQLFTTRRRILVATPDVLQPKMAGPAIRAFQMALELSRDHDVELVSTIACDFSHPAFAVHHVSDAELKAAVAKAEVVIIQGHLIEHHPWLRKTDKVLVADIYDPFHLEVLEQARDLSPNDRRVTTRLTFETLNEQLARGDFFLCASEKQRDFWIGQLAAVGRINPSTYDQNESLDNLIAIAPFGVNEDKPVHTRNVLRSVVPGIGADDKVILWGGGVYNWFDPLTLLHALDKLRRRLPNVRLFFMGMDHPNPLVPAMQMTTRTRALADELDLVGTHVFFNAGWVDYDDRQNYLLEADVGVSTHLDHVETAFSFRTRLLDYLWASLPIIASDGDGFANEIQRRGLGRVVPPGDVDGLEEALFSLLDDESERAACRSAIEEFVPELHWSKVLAPLLEFCREPKHAVDLTDPRQRVMIGDPMVQAMWGRRGWKHTAQVAIAHIGHAEWRDLFRKVRMRVRTMRQPVSAGPGARTDTF